MWLHTNCPYLIGYRVIATVFGLGAWMILVVKATSAIVMAILSLQLYSGLVSM